MRSMRGGLIPFRRLRGELRALVERWGQKGFEDAFPDADVFEIRCAEERAVLEAAARGDEEARFAAAERAYRREIEARYGQIEIRGLQLSARPAGSEIACMCRCTSRSRPRSRAR